MLTFFLFEVKLLSTLGVNGNFSLLSKTVGENVSGKVVKTAVICGTSCGVDAVNILGVGGKE